MRKLRNPAVVFDGKHWKIEVDKRKPRNSKDTNVVEIIHITLKDIKKKYEYYCSNYGVQIESDRSKSRFPLSIYKNGQIVEGLHYCLTISN
ncbi:hypothetical protein ACFLQ6_05505 [Thermoproteota archaeon]